MLWGALGALGGARKAIDEAQQIFLEDIWVSRESYWELLAAQWDPGQTSTISFGHQIDIMAPKGGSGEFRNWGRKRNRKVMSKLMDFERP